MNNLQLFLRLAVCFADFVLAGVIIFTLTTAPSLFTFMLAGAAMCAWWRAGKYYHWTAPWN